MLPKLNLRGFTLIELLVAISILAIIAAIGLTSYTQAQKLSRDNKRKQDLRGIAVALELYKQKNGSYPKLTPAPTGCSNIGGDLYCYSNNATTPWLPSLSGFTDFVPKDPLSNNGDPNGAGSYGYAYMNPVTYCTNEGDGKYFMLFTKLENTSDPERLAVNDRPLCPQKPSTLNMGFNGNLFVITSY